MDERTTLEVDELTLQATARGKTTVIVDGLSFAARKGRLLAIVGESGSGKSMTVASVSQLLPPAVKRLSGRISLHTSEGTVAIDRLERKSRRMRLVRGVHIGMIFQDPMAALNPSHTIGQQVTERLLAHSAVGRREAKVRAIALLDSLGIRDAAGRFDRYPHEFSGGMRQRVMIAIALICDPELLIADEPTTALDVTVQAQIMRILRTSVEVHDRAVILITHNMGLVANYADDVIVMYQGKVVERGEVSEVLANPQHPYTRGLLRSVPVIGMDRELDLATISSTFIDRRGAGDSDEHEQVNPEMGSL